MSPASRRRFRLHLMSIDWSRYKSFWVSLTYHNRWPASSEGWKRDLDVFGKRVWRRWGARGLEFFTWRLERQQRGAPHHHLIFSFREGSDVSAGAFRAWCTRAWLQIVGGWESDWAAMAHGVDVQNVVSVDRHDRPQLGGILGYLVSEHCKVDQDAWGGEHTGRVWGISGQPTYVTERVVELDEVALECVLERVRARGAEIGSWYWQNVNSDWPGFCLLGDGQELVAQLLEGVPHRVLASSP